jgi:hypothetical protein
MGARYLKTEDTVIAAKFPTASREEMLKRIPNRTWPQICAHANRKGILRTHQAKGNSIREGRKKLRGAWSDDENNRFNELYPVATHEELLLAFPNRSIAGLTSHAHRQRLFRSHEAKGIQLKIGRENARKEGGES